MIRHLFLHFVFGVVGGELGFGGWGRVWAAGRRVLGVMLRRLDWASSFVLSEYLA
jgi:hypothetical protein